MLTLTPVACAVVGTESVDFGLLSDEDLMWHAGPESREKQSHQISRAKQFLEKVFETAEEQVITLCFCGLARSIAFPQQITLILAKELPTAECSIFLVAFSSYGVHTLYAAVDAGTTLIKAIVGRGFGDSMHTSLVRRWNILKSCL